jgi:hypothetical protein
LSVSTTTRIEDAARDAERESSEATILIRVARDLVATGGIASPRRRHAATSLMAGIPLRSLEA